MSRKVCITCGHRHKVTSKPECSTQKPVTYWQACDLCGCTANESDDSKWVQRSTCELHHLPGPCAAEGSPTFLWRLVRRGH